MDYWYGGAKHYNDVAGQYQGSDTQGEMCLKSQQRYEQDRFRRNSEERANSRKILRKQSLFIRLVL